MGSHSLQKRTIKPRLAAIKGGSHEAGQKASASWKPVRDKILRPIPDLQNQKLWESFQKQSEVWGHPKNWCKGTETYV